MAKKVVKKTKSPLGERPTLSKEESAKLKKIKDEKFLAVKNEKDERMMSIIESDEFNREDAQWLIQDYLGLSLYDFCEKYELDYKYYKECFSRKRPFLKEAQDKIREACALQKAGVKLTISFG